MAQQCKYSCQTATDTLAWINAIIEFLRPYSTLINAHVVNFFKVCNPRSLCLVPENVWENDYALDFPILLVGFYSSLKKAVSGDYAQLLVKFEI